MKKLTLITAAAALFAFPATAGAHVFIENSSQPADAYPVLEVVVPHGCDGSPTTSVTVSIPKSVPTVTPGRNAFWELSTKEGPKDETELFGETITEGVSEVTWTATEPLPDDQLDTLLLEAKLPNTPDETIHFPTIQTCEQGETKWIEIPAEGQTEDDLESPAPAVELTAAEGEHGGGGEESEEGSSDNDSASMGLGIAALALGALGLLAGSAALVRSRS